ncbi:M48 family metallopeptidase [Crenobacter sp. SG2305]|uniref:M48 family metallopeptidase n=1 Tax=Crenobacter oryzisoli TaxID=3056844 RepID=UPI0025AB4B72|nr:M48 family metallopeptidase [Crenobacter sp. SG2305]MDN0082925.1 M48 family metallopeptidase [Crenobacter sp. SG2305]
MATTLTLLFLIALAVTLALRLWLASRQIAHVRAHRNAVPVEFSGEIPLSDHQKAADYTVAKTRLGMLNAATDTAMILLFTLGGGLEWLWQLSSHLFNGDIARGLALVCGVTIISSLVSLPFTIVTTFGIEARYGFNKITPKLFIADLLRGILLSAALGLPILALVLWLMAKMGSAWWLWVWLAWTGISLLMLVLYPTLIAPLFNKFSPLDDASLKERIEALLTRTGFASRGVYVMDGSKRSSHGNAYFTGFGAAKRIVFFDTLLKQLTPAEIEAVLAHELGHFKLKHITQRMVLTFALSLGFLFVLGLLIDAPWFYQGLGVATPSTAMALVLFFMAVPAFTFPLTPLSSLQSRRHEYQADDFAAKETDSGELIHALTKLYRDNAATLTPDPLHSAFYDSHPPAALRIAHLKGARP